jgi:hypothetical protein
MSGIAMASQPGAEEKPNEDWVSTSPSLIVVVDGGTARTETGCVHGVAWYAAMLGTSFAAAAGNPSTALKEALAHAIRHVARLHPECDLTNPGTPSAAVAIVRVTDRAVQYLVLGDTMIVLDKTDDIDVICDDRVDATARTERAEANRFPIGSDEKQAALLRMKYAELAARNKPGGFWVAAADPAVVNHAIDGQAPNSEVHQLAVLTDGAARITTVFGLLDWTGVLDLLADKGPTELIRRVRSAESADPDGVRWPRNKTSDDATVVYSG